MELKKLIGAVAEHTVFLDELLVLLERETEELSNVKIEEMAQTNMAKEELLRKIAGHSSALQQNISTVADSLGLSSQATLGTIVEHVAKKGHGELQVRQNRLKATAERVKQVAAMNHEIAERFASTISTSLNLVTRMINQSNFYGASGGFQQRPTGAVMINKEA